MRDGSFDVGGCVDRLDDDDVVGMGGLAKRNAKQCMIVIGKLGLNDATKE